MVVVIGSVEASELFSSLPPIQKNNSLERIRSLVARSGRKIVVLDDDPTGTQTVYGTPVLTQWSIPSLLSEFATKDPLFFILTNSRSLPERDAAHLMKEIVQNLNEASMQVGYQYVIISRSDSTLRGHFEAETAAIINALPYPIDGVILAPFFEEGGRFTINDIHYVLEGSKLIPVADTEFARDKAFGFHSSNLREWVEEKTHQRVVASAVSTISIEDLRLGGTEKAASILRSLNQRQICVVNAANYSDLETLILGLLQIEEEGKHFLYRTAASFVRIRAGIATSSLWSPWFPADKRACHGGLIVAGSYVQKSTLQLESLIQAGDIMPIEVEVNHLLHPTERLKVINMAAKAAEEQIRVGREVLIYTSRTLVQSGQGASFLKIGQSISDALVEIIEHIQTSPAWIITKGGITSSDIATKALGIKRAIVLGQIEKGIPVWQTGEDCRWPALPLIIFPGNVGEVDTLRHIVQKLRGGYGPESQKPTQNPEPGE